MELETVLLQHPDVRDVGVVGITNNQNIIEDELPMAFVVKQEGSTITEQKLIDYVDAEVKIIQDNFLIIIYK